MKKQNFRSILAKASLALALLLPIWFAVAAKGSAWRWWSWQVGLGKMTMDWGMKLTVAAIVLALLSLLASIVLKPRRGVLTAIIALAIPIGIIAYANNVRSTVRGLPFIHDVSTDTVAPPGVSATLLALRGEHSNPAHYVGKKDPRGTELVSVLQLQGYPDIQPLILDGSVADVRHRVVTTIDQFGWQLHTNDPQTGIIEATHKTFWYGFLDDVIIRVRESGDQSRVDIRSISRIGASDMGKNAARIRRLSKALTAP